MTSEQAGKNVEAIVRWINTHVTKMDRYLHYGFGRRCMSRYLDHDRAWDLLVKKDGSVEISGVGTRGDFDRFDGEDTRYYPHYTYFQLAEKEEAAANDLMLEWPSIKEAILGEVERLKSIEDFQV